MPSLLPSEGTTGGRVSETGRALPGLGLPSSRTLSPQTMRATCRLWCLVEAASWTETGSQPIPMPPESEMSCPVLLAADARPPTSHHSVSYCQKQIILSASTPAKSKPPGCLAGESPHSQLWMRRLLGVRDQKGRSEKEGQFADKLRPSESKKTEGF